MVVIHYTADEEWMEVRFFSFPIPQKLSTQIKESESLGEMTSYYFATYHQKRTIAPTCKRDIKMPKDLRDAASAARTKMVAKFEFVYLRPHELGNDASLKELELLAETYLRWCVRLIEAGFRNELYCYWGESLCPKTNHAFNDLHYDMANVLWNLACVDMGHANYIVTHNVTTNNLEAVEKEAYSILCTAAGRYALARELVSSVSTKGTDGNDNYLLADITPDFLSMLEKIALAQAQEIGASKAHRRDDGVEKKSAKDGLTAKLTHQVFKLYQEAAQLATRKIACPTEKFNKLIIFLEMKAAVYESLTYAYTASSLYDEKPEDALWCLRRSTELLSPVHARIEKADFDRFVYNFMQGAERTQFHIQDKIDSMNRLVVRAKPADGPITLQPPQVLARAKEVKLPEAAVVATDGNAALGDWDLVHHEGTSPTSPKSRPDSPTTGSGGAAATTTTAAAGPTTNSSVPNSSILSTASNKVGSDTPNEGSASNRHIVQPTQPPEADHRESISPPPSMQGGHTF